MDALAELIMSPAYSIKSKNPSQDQKQNPSKDNAYKKNKYSHIAEEQVNNFAVKQRNSWSKSERRTGKDRRKQLDERGRWLESREAKDRRSRATDIFVKI